MQSVSSTFLSVLQSNNLTAKSLVFVVEFYKSSALPTADGFDPAGTDFLMGVSTVSGITFRTRTYKQLANSIGDTKTTLKKELSSFSVTLNNQTREIIDFEYATGFEGLICVKRLIDRNTSVALADSAVKFTGGCEKPDSFERSSESVTITVKQILSGTEINIPRRTFAPDDAEGRPVSDPLNEGFRYQQRSGTVVYQETVKKRYLLFFTKKVKESRTLQYSSQSDLDSSRAVPLALGRVQMQAIQLAGADIGSYFQGTCAFVDGHEHGIGGYGYFRSVTPGVGLIDTNKKLGLPGMLGGVPSAGFQVNDEPTWIGNGIYSRTAFVFYSAGGTNPQTDDPLPDIVANLLGLRVPTPGTDGVFDEIKFTDNPVVLCRWLLNSAYYFNLEADWLDDAQNLIEADYCDHILVDQANTDTVQLAASQTGIAGTDYFNYKSTGAINPVWFLNKTAGTQDLDAYMREADYQFYAATPYNSDDWNGDGLPDYSVAPTEFRRRYTLNILLGEQMKAIDFLFDVLLPTCNGLVTQSANGKIAIKVARPEDFAFVHTANLVGATNIRVRNINPFAEKPGRILIGANLATSEVRSITGFSYDDQITYAVSASGGVSSSGANLAGTGGTTPMQVTLTVSSASGTKTVTINGFALSYTPAGDDTTVSVAAMIAGQINSHNELNKYIKASWTAGASTVVVSSRIGYLLLDAALDNIHNAPIADPTSAPTGTETASGTFLAGAYQIAYSFVTIEGETLTGAVLTKTVAANKKIVIDAVTMPARAVAVNWYASVEANGIRRRFIKTNNGASWTFDTLPKLDEAVEPIFNTTAAECHRVAMAFTDRANPQTGLTTSNVVAGSFTFPQGGGRSSVNQIVGKYRDASQDFQLTPLPQWLKDKAHIAKVKKVNPYELNLAGVDNYHQAVRLGGQKLQLLRDGDTFHGLVSDGEALLLQEGDVVCVTDDSGRFINEPVRIEELSFSNSSGYPSASFKARKYRRAYFDDQIRERLVPLPIVTNTDPNTEQSAAVIYQFSAATNTSVQIGINNFSTSARFRKVEISNNADMSGAATLPIIQSVYQLPNVELVTKTGEAAAVTKYFRMSHSSNGVTYGDASNILGITFANSGGTGGDPPEIDPNPSCFGGETLFTLATGHTVRMEILFAEREKYIGQWARSFDAKGVVCYGQIADVFCHTAKEHLLVKFSTDAEPIRVTKMHRFLLESGKFKTAGKLKTADKVKEFRNNEWREASVEWMEKVKETIFVYNAHIKKTQVYFANDKAVHNVKPIEA